MCYLYSYWPVKYIIIYIVFFSGADVLSSFEISFLHPCRSIMYFGYILCQFSMDLYRYSYFWLLRAFYNGLVDAEVDCSLPFHFYFFWPRFFIDIIILIRVTYVPQGCIMRWHSLLYFLRYLSTCRVQPFRNGN